MTKSIEEIKKEQSYKSMFMFGMFSIVMLFAGLTSAYIVSKGFLDTKWEVIKLPHFFLYSTMIIIMSSGCLFVSILAFKKEQKTKSKNMLLAAILLGILFFFFQINGWKSLVSDGYFFSGNNIASSYIYVFSGLHLVHIIFGLTFLVFSFLKMHFKKRNSESFLTLKLKYWFWHFLGVLWVYLYGFLSFLN